MSAYFSVPLSALTTRWRIFYAKSADFNPRDERSDFEELRGRGDFKIYRYSQTELTVHNDDWHLIARLKSRLKDSGVVFRPKTPCVALFRDQDLDIVAKAIGAKTKRQYSPQQLEQARLQVAKARQFLKPPCSSSVREPKTDDRPLA